MRITRILVLRSRVTRSRLTEVAEDADSGPMPARWLRPETLKREGRSSS